MKSFPTSSRFGHILKSASQPPDASHVLLHPRWRFLRSPTFFERTAWCFVFFISLERWSSVYPWQAWSFNCTNDLGDFWHATDRGRFLICLDNVLRSLITASMEKTRFKYHPIIPSQTTTTTTTNEPHRDLELLRHRHTTLISTGLYLDDHNFDIKLSNLVWSPKKPRSGATAKFYIL